MAPTAPDVASDRDSVFVIDRCFERDPAGALVDFEAVSDARSW